jgi:hypothetical protein
MILLNKSTANFVAMMRAIGMSILIIQATCGAEDARGHGQP